MIARGLNPYSGSKKAGLVLLNLLHRYDISLQFEYMPSDGVSHESRLHWKLRILSSPRPMNASHLLGDLPTSGIPRGATETLAFHTSDTAVSPALSHKNSCLVAGYLENRSAAHC